MGDWQSIFKEQGRVFQKPTQYFSDAVRLMKKEGKIRVLDLGCGTGRHTIELSKLGFDVYATDVSVEGVRQTKEWLKDEGLRAQVKQHSCYRKFPYKDSFFDAVVSTQVIHHNYIDKVRFCISEIKRVLKPGGIIFISVAGPRKDNHHFHKVKFVAPMTYMPVEGDEKGLVHYMYTKEQMAKDFNAFRIISIRKDRHNHLCLLGNK